MTERELDSIMMADALRHAARTRKENLQLFEDGRKYNPEGRAAMIHRKPRPSKDNIGAHDSHKANTFRPFPRTRVANPTRENGGTSPNMAVIHPDGSVDIVPAIPTWRKHLKPKVIVVKDHKPETARRGGSQAEYD